MEYEDQEDEQEGEVAYNDSLANPNPPHRPNKMLIPAQPAAVAPLSKHKYKECLKNHAVGIGGHATDGCREFMPVGEEGTLESLQCAACDCHRNFHRREREAGGGAFPINQYSHQQQLLLAGQHPRGQFGYRSPSGYLMAPPQQLRAAAPGPLPLSSSSGGGVEGSRDEMEDYYSNPSSEAAAAKKRFRTKFTAEQKDMMQSLAERMDWKIQKQDEELVQKFCGEVGITRHVLKVWMHNNKNTHGKKT